MKALDVRPDNLPVELIREPRWVGWKYETTGGEKPTKVPYQVGGRKASSTDRRTWSDFDTVYATYKHSEWDGIGYVLDGSKITMLDLDNCGTDHHLVRELGSYAELSPSGNGVRIVIQGVAPRGLTTPGLEVYSTGRYMTMTGHRLNDKPIADGQWWLDALFSDSRTVARELSGQRSPGERHDALVSLAGSLRLRGMEPDEILTQLVAYNTSHCQNVYSVPDLERIARDAGRWEKGLVVVEDESPAVSSWTPQSLVALAKTPPEPPTIGGLLYPGMRTVISGETEAMKTWLALILCKAEMEAGFPVYWADLDAMGPNSLLHRLKVLSVDEDKIDRLFLYTTPEQMLEGPQLDEVCNRVQQLGVRLFVFDAFNSTLGLHGLEPNNTPDVEKFWSRIADPLCKAGAAVTLIDHVVKNMEQRGKYAFGSERKVSGAAVHLGLELKGLPLNRGGTGRTEVSVHKDRPGFHPRPKLGTLVLDGDTITYRLELTNGAEFRPTRYMEKVSRYVEGNPEVTGNDIEKNVEGGKEHVRKAKRILVEEGYLSATSGPRRATLHSSIKPYREADEPPVPEALRLDFTSAEHGRHGAAAFLH